MNEKDRKFKIVHLDDILFTDILFIKGGDVYEISKEKLIEWLKNEQSL